jgi:hypothetical protein
MWYAVTIIAALLVAVLLLRLRVRLRVDDSHRLLFIGLGQSGPELDFQRKIGVIRLFGLRLSTFSLEKEEKPAAKPKEEEPPEKRPKRHRPPGAILAVVKDSLRPVWRYTIGMFRSVAIEEMEGRINGGFESPDITGQAFGYYQAVLGAVPALAGRLVYQPDWTGESFSASVRFSVAMPLYKMVYHSLLLVVRLPLRKIIKLAIGAKKGDQDGQ